MNVLIGYSINVFANMLVLPLFGFHVSVGQAVGIGIVFTVISIARSYLLRRYFNSHISKQLRTPAKDSDLGTSK